MQHDIHAHFIDDVSKCMYVVFIEAKDSGCFLAQTTEGTTIGMYNCGCWYRGDAAHDIVQMLVQW